MSTTKLTESDVLPIGVEVGGTLHREFTLRPALVRDNVDAVGEVGTGNPVALSAALFARQLVKLGSLDAKQITTELVLGMHVEDFNALDRAAEQLQKKVLVAARNSSGGSTPAPSLPGTEFPPITP